MAGRERITRSLVGGRREAHAWTDAQRKWTERFHQTPEDKNKSMPKSVPHHRRSGKVQKSGQTRVIYHARPKENRHFFGSQPTETGTHPLATSWKFSGQVKDKQRNPPWMLKQLSEAEQVWIPAAHSSMSEVQGKSKIKALPCHQHKEGSGLSSDPGTFARWVPECNQLGGRSSSNCPGCWCTCRNRCELQRAVHTRQYLTRRRNQRSAPSDAAHREVADPPQSALPSQVIPSMSLSW